MSKCSFYLLKFSCHSILPNNFLGCNNVEPLNSASNTAIQQNILMLTNNTVVLSQCLSNNCFIIILCKSSNDGRKFKVRILTKKALFPDTDLLNNLVWLFQFLQFIVNFSFGDLDLVGISNIPGCSFIHLVFFCHNIQLLAC